MLDEEITSEKKKRKDFKPSKDKEQSASTPNGKTQSKPSSIDKFMNKEEMVHDAALEAEQPMNDEEDEVFNTWFDDLVKAKKDPNSFDDLMGSIVDFTKFTMNLIKKDKITKADLEGPVFKLLKGTCRNSIELEYHMEHYYLALSDKLDWTNLEGDKCPFDISKPIPLTAKEAYDKNAALGILHWKPKRYKHDMPKRAWTEKDHQWTAEMLKLINNMLLERRIMRILECDVGGRTNETDYRLRMRTI
nr:hypothetical protein [Tanacetum cinerariifolium]